MAVHETAVRERIQVENTTKQRDKYYRVRVWGKWCKGCGLCVAFCPRQVFQQDGDHHPIVARPERCAGCQWCAIHCPDFAILVEEVSSAEEMVAK